VDEIIASLFETVVHQNLATLTKDNTPMPGVLLLGGPNLFFRGLREAWQHHLGQLWKERGTLLPPGATPQSLIQVPQEALYCACLGCIGIGGADAPTAGVFSGTEALAHWIEHGQWEAKARDGAKGLSADAADLARFKARYGTPQRTASPQQRGIHAQPVVVGCDFGSTTAKAVVMNAAGELLADCDAPSAGNPIKDAKAVLRRAREAGFEHIDALAITGYGKDLLKDIVGADVSVVETVAYATAALHYFPDADVICDVGGCDVKIMILRQGTVADFRLNSQCSSANGAFLQGVAERYDVPLDEYADRAFQARAIPALAMGCGVFLQSDIVNQQRKGWSAEEIILETAVGRVRVGCDQARWQGATTQRADARKEEQHGQRAPARLNRARSAVTHPVMFVVGTHVSTHAACPPQRFARRHQRNEGRQGRVGGSQACAPRYC